MMTASKLSIILVALLGACGPVEEVQQSGLTGMDIRLTYDTAIDQVKITSTSFEEIISPDSPEIFSPSGEDIIVLLPDDLGAATIKVQVDGLWGGRRSATGESEVSLVEKEIVLTAIQMVEVNQ